MRRLATYAGATASLLLFCAVLWWIGGDVRFRELTEPVQWAKLAAAVLLYASVILLGTVAWRVLLHAFGQRPDPWTAERQLLISQIGKYLPGNFAHFAGRFTLALRDGLSGPAVGAALLTETAVTVAGGLVTAIAGLALVPDLKMRLAEVLPEQSRLIWLVVALAGAMLALYAATEALRRFRGLEDLPRPRLSLVFAAFLIFPVSFTLLALSLQVVQSITAPGIPVPFTLMIAVFAAAWIAGLLTPGAPGGLGVRETVLTLGLTPLVGGPAALSAALLHRGVSIAGDVLCFALGLLLPRSQGRS